MASSAGDKPRKAQGIRIDSSLISKASGGDVQNELEGLGVNVFDQGTFEEGVMKQLDEEVARHTVKQRQRFLVEEYSRVKQERNTLQRELESLSQKIAALLSRPLCDVVLTLREMKSTQEQKRKQVVQLETRERELLKKISGQGGNDDDSTVGDEGVADVAFGIPMTSWDMDQQRLIQSGHMTPFGTSGHSASVTVNGVGGSEEGRGSEPMEGGEGGSVTKSDETAPSSSGLRLCSEGFDGLFEVHTPVPVTKSVRKKGGKGASPTDGQKKGKGKAKMKGSRVVDGEEGVLVESRVCGGDPGEGRREAVGEDGTGELGGEWIPTKEEVEEMEKEMAEEGWGEDEDTEYTTDEEMGADYVLGRVGFGGRRVKKPKRRPLSSGESGDDEEGEGGMWGRRRRRKRRRQSQAASSQLDDGDEHLFQLRMMEYERENDGLDPATPSSADKVIDGRLRVPGSVWTRLYGYQRTGVHWLWELHCQQAGGVVGDEMGLGKTIQMIAFFAALRVSRLRSHVTKEVGLGPVLIVCPATVLHQWVSEFHSWWPQFRVAVLHDTGTYRGPKPALVEDIIECSGVLITTYAGVRIYRDLLLSRKWDYVVLDEGHKIRNPDAEVTLVCKQFPTPHRIILSGSPMQNNLRELWSLFDFVFPGKLGTLPVFMEQFSVPITMGGYSNASQVQVQTAYRCACVLRDTINPYLLRRLKADVKIQLPSKNEQVLFCKLTDYQQELYEEYVTGPDVAAMLSGRKKIFTGLSVLRKLCNHPDLVTNDYRERVTYVNGVEGGGGEEEEDDEDTALIRTRRPPEMRRKRIASLRDSGSEGEGMSCKYCEERYGWGQRSGKMIVVEALLKMWFHQKHRVLLFSQSKMMLSILELMVQAKGYSYIRMDGDTPIGARQPLIRRFNETSSIFVFLLTTRVGGLGVNLTGADRIIIYDPDWNPSTDTQARERAWRIGQKRQVTIYRLLTSGTIEEKIYHRQIFKQFLSNRVLKDPRQRRFFKANDLYELFSLGQIHPKGQTETSAIFAGTGSDVIPKKLKKQRSHDRGDGLRKGHPKSCDPGDGEREGRSENRKEEMEGVSVSTSETQSLQELHVTENQNMSQENVSGNSGPQTSNAVSLDSVSPSNEPLPPATPCPSDPSQFTNHRSSVKMKKRKKSKKHRKKKHRGTIVEGVEISGVDRTGLYRAEEEDKQKGSSHDDYILTKLFKKSGVHSAIQHDSIMSSSSSDYILVETEAKKVAQSAARALRESRRRCLRGGGGGGGGWGQLTWTGQHGSAGGSGTRQQPRFGAKSHNPHSNGQVSNSSQLFDGQKAGTALLTAQSSQPHTSSSALLATIRQRNAPSLPQYAVKDIHKSSHDILMREIRDFIATGCKFNGQATTEELLGHFSSKLPNSDTATFRSMLREICDFSRVQGEGRWILKSQFR